MIGQALSVVRTDGLSGLLAWAGNRFIRPQARSFHLLRERFKGMRALEIGGPSACFSQQGFFPVYPLLAAADNCNFAGRTIWEGTIEPERGFQFASGRAPGHQFIAEATDLGEVAAESYDLVLSCHTIEHTANPLKALHEWRRVLRSGGLIVLVVPHKDGTFDHRRPVTALDHLVADFERGTGEDDTTHLSEVLALHDLSRDPGSTTRDAFTHRSQDNFVQRALHHHVFDTPLAEAAMRQAGFHPLVVEARWPCNILVIAEKREGTDPAPRRFASPFRSDRIITA